MTVFVDADTMCYASGFSESEDNMKINIDSTIEQIKTATQCDNIELWVESPFRKNIFRNHVAVTRPYKGNRKDKQPPQFLREAKLYLINDYGAQQTNFLESEDCVMIRAHEEGRDNCIIASVDKDMRQAPFKFYDYKGDALWDISEQQAEYNFWEQVLIGDLTDNIVGLPKVGKKTAAKILEDNYEIEVATEYVKRGFSYEYFVEQCRLLYILRSWNDVFTPQITKEEYNELYLPDSI